MERALGVVAAQGADWLDARDGATNFSPMATSPPRVSRLQVVPGAERHLQPRLFGAGCSRLGELLCDVMNHEPTSYRSSRSTAPLAFIAAGKAQGARAVAILGRAGVSARHSRRAVALRGGPREGEVQALDALADAFTTRTYAKLCRARP